MSQTYPVEYTPAGEVIGSGGAEGVTGVADPGSNGFMARTAYDTSVARTIEGGAGVSVANSNGVDGNPIISVSGSLQIATPTPFTHAQIRSIPVDAGGIVTLLAAPGEGKVNIFLGAYLILDASAGGLRIQCRG